MIAGLDAGTSVVKAVAFDGTGRALAVAARDMRTSAPAPGWREQDQEQVVAAAGAVLRELAQRTGRQPELVGVTGQGDGVWLLDADGRPVRPAILWSDARAAPIVDRWLADGVAGRVFARSRNGLFPGASAPLLAWLAQHEPDSLRRSATAAYCKDMLFQRLTGARLTDVSDASLPFLDVRVRRYDPALLDACGLAAHARLLAPIAEGTELLRPLSAAGTGLTGLPEGTPVHAGPFDLVAMPLGAGLAAPGDALVILGTTLGCCVLADAPPGDGPAVGMTLCVPGSTRCVRVMAATAGTPSLEWLLALLGAERGELDGLLAQSPAGARGVVALPLLSPAGERAPFVDPAARGSFHGLSLETSHADLVRALCEGIAFHARHCLEAARLGAGGAVSVTGGGSRSAGWRQLLADVLGRPLRIARGPEVGARGAALAALQAAGGAEDVRWTLPDGVVEPRRSLRGHYEVAYADYRARLDAARSAWSGPGAQRPALDAENHRSAA